MNFLEEVEARERRYVYFVIAIAFVIGIAVNTFDEFKEKIHIRAHIAITKPAHLAEYYRAPGIPILNP